MGAGLLQPTHIIFVVVIALLVFGPKRLPEMGRSIGNGIREFKDSIDGNSNDSHSHNMETSDHPHGTESARVADLPPAAAPTATMPPAAAAPTATPVATRSGAPVSR